MKKVTKTKIMKTSKPYNKDKIREGLEHFKFDDYSHSENDSKMCSSFYKRCSVCQVSSDNGATRKECRHPWVKYKWEKCDCGAEENWNKLQNYLFSVLDAELEREVKKSLTRELRKITQGIHDMRFEAGMSAITIDEVLRKFEIILQALESKEK